MNGRKSEKEGGKKEERRKEEIERKMENREQRRTREVVVRGMRKRKNVRKGIQGNNKEWEVEISGYKI